MTTKADRYREILRELDDWEPFLLAESGLPGPRANLELVAAVADLGDEALFEQLLRDGPEVAPTDHPRVFLAVCGVVGLGRLLAEGRLDLLIPLRGYAGDPRWRMREGVCMALQRLGRRDMDCLLDEMARWSTGTPLEQRAAAAALCEPSLLGKEGHARRTLAILDSITGSVLRREDRRSEGFKVLRQGLGYCWSVAVAALPEAGVPLMEKWLACDDRDVRWIMKQNLGKARLARADPEWVARCQALL
jgi:hypothetical protein